MAKESIPNKCKEKVEGKDRFGFITGYFSCDKPVKFKCTYLNINNKPQEVFVCGVHKNSIVNWSKRVLKHLKFNCKLKVEKIDE